MDGRGKQELQWKEYIYPVGMDSNLQTKTSLVVCEKGLIKEEHV
jgi:hypothetical protein